MGAIGIELAEEHLAAARILLETGRMNQAAGLAYQAVDVAFACLIDDANGNDLVTHRQRWLRADQLGICPEDVSNRLWRARNIGFYANVRAGDARVALDADEARWAVSTAADIVGRVRARLERRR